MVHAPSLIYTNYNLLYHHKSAKSDALNVVEVLKEDF